MNTIWNTAFSQGSEQLISSAIRELLKITEHPSTISFAGGLPAPECFPNIELTVAAERVLANQPMSALQYGPTEGYRPLRGFLAERMTGLGITTSLEQIIITSGSQQGLDLLGKLFIDPGAVVAVEEPTYLGALQAWRPYRPEFLTVPLDHEGIDVAVLEKMLRSGKRPRFVYVVSSFQNPAGVTLSPARRQALIEMAAQYDLPIIEDDPYGDIYYGGVRPKPLAALDCELSGELRHVVYLGSFSKILAPGLRVGWAALPRELVGKFVQAKQGMDLHTTSLSQIIVYEVCSDRLLERHIPAVRATYHARRDAMLEALEQHMPFGINWTRPNGGMFLWLTLPDFLDAANLLNAALDLQIAFVPGASFYANGGGNHTLRLNFSHPTTTRIYEGVSRLAQAIQTLRNKTVREA